MKSSVKKLTMLALGASAAFLVTAGGSALADDRGSWRQGGGHHGGWHHGGGRRGKMSRGFTHRYDANKDGKVTQEEIDTNRVARHGKYDANGDGKLSLEEFQGLWMEAYRRKMVREFQEFDVDGDAAVALEEYTEPMSKAVERRDHKGRHGMRRGPAAPADGAAAPSDNTKPAE
jgi:Ca2+-binding EF-hand superfamily protein